MRHRNQQRGCAFLRDRVASGHRRTVRASMSRRLSASFPHTPPVHKAAKFAVLTPGHAGFPNRTKQSEGSDSAPIRNTPVSPCKPLCAILLVKASVYPLSPVKTNVSRLCECDLKPLWRGYPLAVWDTPSAYFGQIEQLPGDFIYSRIKGWRRNRRSAQSLLPAVRAVDGGFNAGGCGAF